MSRPLLDCRKKPIYKLAVLPSLPYADEFGFVLGGLD